MNDLHDIYAKLLKRGMPEHPALKRAEPLGNCWRIVGPSSSAFVDNNDPVARDLLTMHVLRWFSTGTDNYVKSNPLGWAVQNKWLAAKGKQSIFNAPALLEAILAATAHLEGA